MKSDKTFIAWVAVGDGMVRLYDMNTSKLVARIADKGVMGLSVDPKWEYFATWGYNSPIKIWPILSK